MKIWITVYYVPYDMALFYLPSLEMENDITYFVAAAAYSFQERPSLKNHISFI